MCDGEGEMGSPDRETRLKAADNHRKWVDIAAELGCHSIRTNISPGQTQPSSPAGIDAFFGDSVESFSRLCEYAARQKISVIIENHGGVSSNPDVLAGFIKKASLPNLGTLPDFGNFPAGTDKYEAVRKLMPFARGVSFKCLDFTPDARETTMDMDRMMKIVSAAGYRGWVGIEYEGSRLTEFEGIQAAKRCLDRIL
jgi:L-ribulose-5-phosphate 3-epimerase